MLLTFKWLIRFLVLLFSVDKNIDFSNVSEVEVIDMTYGVQIRSTCDIVHSFDSKGIYSWFHFGSKSGGCPRPPHFKDIGIFQNLLKTWNKHLNLHVLIINYFKKKENHVRFNEWYTKEILYQEDLTNFFLGRHICV